MAKIAPVDTPKASSSDTLPTALCAETSTHGMAQLAKDVDATVIFNMLTELPNDFIAGGREDAAPQERDVLHLAQ